MEGFFLIIVGSLMDTFLQNPLGNPIANKPILECFPSFGPDAVRDRRSVPPAPLPGYRVIEVAVSDGSPAAGARLDSITWPPGSAPISVLRGRRHRDPDPGLILRLADQVSLLVPAPARDREEAPGQAGHQSSP
jgi:hypothetical protein